MMDDIDAMVLPFHDKRKLNTFKQQTLFPSDKLENFQTNLFEAKETNKAIKTK